MHPIGVHVGPHVEATSGDGGPLAQAAEMDADGVQIFLTDPQSYKTPPARPDAE
jgi:deoxyribonuclease-4